MGKRFPVIYMEKCNNCLLCMDLCKSGVFAERNDRIYIANPTSCSLDCCMCQKQCPMGAIEIIVVNDKEE